MSFTKNKILSQVELFVTKTIVNSFSDKLLFHNIEYFHRLIEGIHEITNESNCTDEEKEILLVSGWLMNIGLVDLEKEEGFDDPRALFRYCHECSVMIADEFLTKQEYVHKDVVLETIHKAGVDKIPDTKLSKILSDASTIEFALPKAKSKIKKMYEEYILLGVFKQGKSHFYDAAIKFLSDHKYFTQYGQDVLEVKKLGLIQKLKKEKSGLEKNQLEVIQTSLNISEAEMKKLKKSLSAIKGRDDRGIQTMFRTTSRNHYTLMQMVDRKANIMISVNAIIMSLIVTGIIGSIETFCIHNSPILIMLVTAIVSITFAILAITPVSTHGSFTEDEIRKKQGNLLYFGNFHNMLFKDYEWGMLQMMNDGDFLYSSMIRDIYFMGKTIKKRNGYIRKSLNLFLFGFFLTVFLFMIVASLGDFHLGGEVHGSFFD